MPFENFDLLLSDPPAVRVIASPPGATTEPVPLDLAPESLAARYAALLRRPYLLDEDLKKLGSELFQAVFRADIFALFYESVGEARARGNGLRLRLHLDTPALAHLPWELLCARGKDFLSASAGYTVSRYLPVSQPGRTLPIELPLRILVVASAPAGLPPLDVAAEQAALMAALSTMQDSRGVQLTFEFDARRQQVLGRLQTEPVHVLHFIGHGDMTQTGGVVYLEDEQNQPDPIDAASFATLAAACPSLRLVVLNACATAFENASPGFTSMAGHLVRGGLPAVIAMRNPVEDRVAVSFARHLYGNLASGEAIDVALTRTRQQLRLEQGASPAAFATPILYLNRPDGQLFEVVNSYQKQLVQIAQHTVRLHETGLTLAEWKELHDILHLLYQPLYEVYRLASSPYGAEVIPGIWYQFNDILQTRLIPFASETVEFAGQRYTETPAGPRGEEWAVRTLELARSLDQALAVREMGRVQEQASLLRTLFFKHLTLCNQKMVSLLAEVLLVFQQARFSLEQLHASTSTGGELNWTAITGELSALDEAAARIAEWVRLHDLFDRLHIQFATIVANAAATSHTDLLAEPWGRLRDSLVLELIEQARQIVRVGKAFTVQPDGSYLGEAWAVDIKRKSDQIDTMLQDPARRDLSAAREAVQDLDRLIKQHYIRINGKIRFEMSEFTQRSAALQARVAP